VEPGTVRPFREEDLDAVALLRFRCFQRSRHRDPQSVARQLRAVFLAHPWRALGIESLVYEDARGQVLGFRGLQARPMRFRGEPVVAAISSQFMVDPGVRGAGVAIALMRAAMEGPQDLLFTDLANPTAARLWELVRGSEITELSLQWNRPLRPLRWMTGRLGSGARLTWARRLASPMVRALDALAVADATSGFHRPEQRERVRVDDLTVAGHVDVLARLAATYELRPDYDATSLQWTLGLLSRSLDNGDRLVARRVMDEKGDALGFFVAVVRRGAATTVVQMGATRSGEKATFARLLDTAASAGCVDVTGRLQPDQLAWVAEPPVTISLAGTRFIAFSRRPELVDALRRGRAWLTRLDGEWGMGF
jgi:hypothetical protein